VMSQCALSVIVSLTIASLFCTAWPTLRSSYVYILKNESNRYLQNRNVKYRSQSHSHRL
jgi:hypothetical protein